MPPTLADVEKLADQLTEDEQAALVDHLAGRQPGLTGAVATADDAWQTLCVLGSRLAAWAEPGTSMTDAVGRMRR